MKNKKVFENQKRSPKENKTLHLTPNHWGGHGLRSQVWTCCPGSRGCCWQRIFSCSQLLQQQLIQRLPSCRELPHLCSHPLCDGLPPMADNGGSIKAWPIFAQHKTTRTTFFRSQAPQGISQGCPQGASQLNFSFCPNPTSFPPCYKYASQEVTAKIHSAH